VARQGNARQGKTTQHNTTQHNTTTTQHKKEMELKIMPKMQIRGNLLYFGIA
jgi:hypothetical protein